MYSMDECMSSDEEYYYSDRDSFDGLDNDESDIQWIPPKPPSSKVILHFLFLYIYIYVCVCVCICVRVFQ